jgi:hypothetical protein
MNLRIPITLEYREVRVSSSGSSKAVWKQWGTVAISGNYESDKNSLEGDGKAGDTQGQERRGGIVRIRYHVDLAGLLSSKWRLKFSPTPGMVEEVHLVRGLSLEPQGERTRFLAIRVDREVK